MATFLKVNWTQSDFSNRCISLRHIRSSGVQLALPTGRSARIYQQCWGKFSEATQRRSAPTEVHWQVQRSFSIPTGNGLDLARYSISLYYVCHLLLEVYTYMYCNFYSWKFERSNFLNMLNKVRKLFSLNVGLGCAFVWRVSFGKMYIQFHQINKIKYRTKFSHQQF